MSALELVRDFLDLAQSRNPEQALKPDTLQVTEILDLGNDIKLYRYQKEHQFIAPGIYVITVNNDFLLDDIINLSEPINFIVYSTIIIDYFSISSNNYYPNFENLQTDCTIENGVFRYRLISNDVEWPVTFRYERNYTQNVDVYSLPEAINFISLDFYTGEFVWDKPVQPGKYLHLQLGGFHAPVQVRIFDVLGREVYETQIAAASQVEMLRIPNAYAPKRGGKDQGEIFFCKA